MSLFDTDSDRRTAIFEAAFDHLSETPYERMEFCRAITAAIYRAHELGLFTSAPSDGAMYSALSERQAMARGEPSNAELIDEMLRGAQYTAGIAEGMERAARIAESHRSQTWGFDHSPPAVVIIEAIRAAIPQPGVREAVVTDEEVDCANEAYAPVAGYGRYGGFSEVVKARWRPAMRAALEAFVKGRAPNQSRPHGNNHDDITPAPNGVMTPEFTLGQHVQKIGNKPIPDMLVMGVNWDPDTSSWSYSCLIPLANTDTRLQHIYAPSQLRAITKAGATP